MGRPSKLTEHQREEAIRRAAKGDSVSSIARDMGVHHSQISRIVSHKVEKITSLATTLANTEVEISRMGRAEQIAVRSMADRMKSIQTSYAETADNGARTAAHLSRLARAKAERLDENAETEDLRAVAALAETANKALDPASKMIAANKGASDSPIETQTTLIVQGVPPRE